VEREPFCQRILSKHWPTVPIHDDICTFQPPPQFSRHCLRWIPMPGHQPSRKGCRPGWQPIGPVLRTAQNRSPGGTALHRPGERRSDHLPRNGRRSRSAGRGRV
jgi:hypothetical protein